MRQHFLYIKITHNTYVGGISYNIFGWQKGGTYYLLFVVQTHRNVSAITIIINIKSKKRRKKNDAGNFQVLRKKSFFRGGIGTEKLNVNKYTYMSTLKLKYFNSFNKIICYILTKSILEVDWQPNSVEIFYDELKGFW